MQYVKYISETQIEKAPVNTALVSNYNSDSERMAADGYRPLEEVPPPEDMRQPVKSYRQYKDKIVEFWTDAYVDPTIDEQNESIRKTRENAYKATSDYLKADYDEAVARGDERAELIKQEWLSSKDKIRAENPYITEG